MSYEEGRNLLDNTVKHECVRRAQLYEVFRPQPDDTQRQRDLRAGMLIDHIHENWANDPVQWIKDCAWSPDPKDRFGQSAVPPGLAPRGMVPVMPFECQAEFVTKIQVALTGREPPDIIF